VRFSTNHHFYIFEVKFLAFGSVARRYLLFLLLKLEPNVRLGHYGFIVILCLLYTGLVKWAFIVWHNPTLDPLAHKLKYA